MLALDSFIAKGEWAQQTQLNDTRTAIGAVGKAVADAGGWQAAVQKLIDFQRIGDDWDGFGAKSLPPDLLKSAIGLAYLLADKGLEPPSGLLHSADGTVVFEWQTTDGVYAELEIDSPLHAEVMLIEPGKPAKHWILPME